MLPDVQNTSPNFSQVILRRIMPVIVIVFALFTVFIAVSQYNTIQAGLSSDHQQAATLLQAQLIAELNFLLRENQEVSNAGSLRAQAEQMLANDRSINELVNGLFSEIIRLNPNEYNSVQYITSNGVILNEVVNERGIPRMLDEEMLPRTDVTVIQSSAFQNALQAVNADEFYLSDFTLNINDNGEPRQPLQAVISIYVPVFDLVNPRTPLGTIRFVVSTDGLLNIINNPILDQAIMTQDNAEASGRHFLLIDERGYVVADSSSVSQDYLLHLINIEPDEEADAFHDTVADYVTTLSNDELILNAHNGTLYTIRNFNTGDSQNQTWHIVITEPEGTLFVEVVVALILFGSLSIVIMFVSLYAINRRMNTALQPLMEVSQRAHQMSTDTSATLPIPSNTHGDIDSLPISSALNTLSERIQSLTDELDNQTNRHNRDMQIITNIGRETATLYNIESLMQQSIELICTELGYYHAQIFLVDDAKVNAVLVQSRGEAGQKLLDLGHRLSIGSDSIIGRATSLATPVIVNDTSTGSTEHAINEILPDTRAEMALPLIIGQEVIGALDIQSTQPDVFHQDDLPTFQLVADQLAVAINSAQLRQQSDLRIEQINRLNRQLTRDAWTIAANELGLDFNYTYNLMTVEESAIVESSEGSIVAPIIIRGEVIGTLNATPPDGYSFSEGDQSIIKAVAERVALAIENARLFQETQVVLSETEVLYQLSRQLSDTASYDDIMSAIIEVVVPTAKGGQIWIFDDYMLGERPLWAQLHTTASHDYTDDNHVSDVIRLNMSQHALLNQLNGSSIFTIEDVTSEVEKDVAFGDLLNQMEAVSLVFIPLSTRGQWKGFITIYFDAPHSYSKREERIYNALIDQAGVAIDNRLLIEQTESALERNEKLYASSRIINTAQSLQDLVYAAVATTSTAQVDFWLGILESTQQDDPWQGTLRIVAQSDMGNVIETDEYHQIAISDNSPMRRREHEIITDHSQGTWMWETPHTFVSAFPLFSDGRPIALFFIVSYEDYQFSIDDYEVYRALTGQMSTQIQNSRLLEQTELALAETQRLYIASRAIAAAQDTDSIFESAAGHLALPFMQSDREQQIVISLMTAHPYSTRNAPQIQYRYQWTSNPDTSLDVPTGTIIPAENAPFAQVLDLRNQSMYYANIAQDLADQPALQTLLSNDDGQSAVIAVLQTRQNWYGVLICKSTTANAFDERYVEFVQAVANQVAIGIENQQLFDAAQSERERLETILSTLPTGIMVLDPHTYVPVLVNENIVTLLGREVSMTEPFSSALYNLYRTGTDLHYPDDDLPIFTAATQGNSQMADDLALLEGNYKIDLLLNAAPIFDTDGKQTAIVAAFQDISNLRSLENTLQENLRETVSLYETQRSLSQAETLDDLLDTILVQLVLMQPDDAYIIIADEQYGTLTATRHLATPLDNVYGLASILPARELLNIREVETNPDITPEAKFQLEKINARSSMILPLRVPSRDTALGWLMITSTQPDHFTMEDERTLTSLGDMARTSIDNRYLVQSTQAALQETRILYAATTTITRSGDLEELGSAIEQAIVALNPDMYAGFITFSPDNLTQLFNVGFESSIDRGMDLIALSHIPLPSREGSVYISDITRSTIGAFEQELLKGEGIVSFTAVNLRVKDMHGGRLLMGFRQARDFSEGETRYLNSIADSASVVIDNQALLEQIQSTLQETSVLYQSSRALTDAKSPSDIVDVVVNYLIGPQVNQVFVALLNNLDWHDVGASVEVDAGWQGDGGVNLQGVTLSADQFPAWEQLAHPSILIINDIFDEDSGLNMMQRTSIESLDTRSLVVIPLRVSNRAIGSIWIGSREAYQYTDADVRIFQAFAESASLSLEAAYLFAQTEHRARQLQTSSEVGQSVGQILDLNVLLPQVVDLIRERFGYDQVQIFLMDERDEYAVLQASTGEAGKQLLEINHKLEKGSDSIIGRVTANAEHSIALDTADARVVHQPNPYLPLTRSEMALPLVVKGKVVGALDVQSNLPNAFAKEDIDALTTLAGQIEIAIDNANLYEEIERRASDMGLLFDITAIAAASQTLEEALQSVTDKLYTAFSASASVFYLPQKYDTYTMLKAIALSGFDQPLSEISEVHIGDSENLVGLVGSTYNPHLLHNIADEARYLSIAPTSSSAMLIPINTSNQLIGLIVVEHEQRNAFSEDDLQVGITLAGSLSAVVENSQLVDELQQTNEQLREVDRLKSQFLANMSHELRTPLNSIIGFSRVMLKGIDGALTEMQEQDLTTIYNSGQHLLNLINDILDQAKIESGKMDLKFAFFGIKTLIESVKSIGIGLVKEKPIDLIIDLESGLPQAYGDEFRTRQILLNIVSNATKFTPEGSITIRAYTIQNEDNDVPFIRIDVVDTGIGIDEKDIPVLFETFRQVDSSLTRTVGGTGLGLPLSKSLAEMQGGELLVSSEVGVGSTFSVTLPTKEVVTQIETEDDDDDIDDAKPPEEVKPDTQSKRPTILTPAIHANTRDSKPNSGVSPDKRVVTQTMKQLTKREILLIEDNKDMVDQFRRLLQREGFDVQTADHPTYAEAMVSNLRPTVLVMDVNFADGEGWNILQRLQQRDDTFDIPIVVCSVNPDTERAYEIGAYHYIQRPFTNEEIIEVVLDAEKESKRERILIIDDQPESVRLLEELLNQSGNYRIFSANNATEGISLVARRQPNLIILDLRMPEKDGFAVLNELRSNLETAEIPVMVITGEVDFTADEQEQLANVHVIHKTDISEEAFDQFIDSTRQHLDGENGSDLQE